MFQQQRHRKTHHHPNHQRNTKYLSINSPSLSGGYQEEHADTLEELDDTEFLAPCRYPAQRLKHDDRNSVIE
jgi:hypothetical protein